MLTITTDNDRFSSLGCGPSLRDVADARYEELLDGLTFEIERHRVAQKAGHPASFAELCFHTPHYDCEHSFTDWTDAKLWSCLISLCGMIVGDTSSPGSHMAARFAYIKWKAGAITTEIVERESRSR